MIATTLPRGIVERDSGEYGPAGVIARTTRHRPRPRLSDQAPSAPARWKNCAHCIDVRRAPAYLRAASRGRRRSANIRRVPDIASLPPTNTPALRFERRAGSAMGARRCCRASRSTSPAGSAFGLAGRQRRRQDHADQVHARFLRRRRRRDRDLRRPAPAAAHRVRASASCPNASCRRGSSPAATSCASWASSTDTARARTTCARDARRTGSRSVRAGQAGALVFEGHDAEARTRRVLSVRAATSMFSTNR